MLIKIKALLAIASINLKINKIFIQILNYNFLDKLNNLNEVAIVKLSRETLNNENFSLLSRNQLQIRLKNYLNSRQRISN